jgi:hypothetical protein
MASGRKWSGGGAHPYLGFGGCGGAAARPHDGDLLPSSTTHGEDDAPVILRSRRVAGWDEGASVVLLGPVVELGCHRIDLAASVSFKVSIGSVWCSEGLPGRSFYRERAPV